MKAWLMAMATATSVWAAAPGEFPGETSDWHGFQRHVFTYDGRQCFVVRPEKAATGNPWVWRARFFGHEPQTDIALLNKGFHVVYMDVGNLFGAPQAVAHWNAFYAYLTQEHGFARRPALEGMSRGGLIIFNWAVANPDKVACIYADAPVCDFKSWPRGKSAGDWQNCLKAYGMTEEEALAYGGNPLDSIAPLAQADVPLLHVCGAADTVVPMAENTDILAERYRALGGRIEVIAKPDCGHHPHSLKDPMPIVDFILANTTTPDSFAHTMLRGDLANCRARFARNKQGRVAFLGGSITNMEGYRPRFSAWLQQRFPETTFDFVNAGISSTCSMTGAFRLSRDVLSKGQVDLLFVEFAVNDNQDAHHAPEVSIRGMEGIVRHALAANPAMDIVFAYTTNESHVASYQRGMEPPEIAAHRRVAAYYGLSEVNWAAEVAERLRMGEFDWQTFGGCHPAPFGNDLYAQTLSGLFARAWSAELPGDVAVAPHTVPAEPLDARSYARGRFLPPESIQHGDGWRYDVPDWEGIPGSKRGRFLNIPLWHATVPGATLAYEFEGTGTALYVLAGPDAGVVEFRVDDGRFESRDLFHAFSKGLHYPRTVMLRDDLPPGRHRVTVRVGAEHGVGSSGSAVRVVGIGAN
jgi:pimeloyl-ACP methyl ester carboxylesterase/lysophospholipase L1-like esterase